MHVEHVQRLLLEAHDDADRLVVKHDEVSVRVLAERVDARRDVGAQLHVARQHFQLQALSNISGLDEHLDAPRAW